ncbi:Eco57I restriction-modification methylase domain-containing protein [Burkholderia sp. USMB20]|uniref:Eco57I restriction-modification methylase domain-containing protein n=1 Tax=Burkholderia sp. USMB20 TaxID=1571773 RepID=UPI0005CDD153|nr:TaqI-like C-terminal specificity domain-containing protein [Burkholderia sp. USMB20]TGN97213.1 hypothetical protein PL79_011635 [Burkholderia sp. USMB20]
MPSNPQLKQSISQRIQAFCSEPLREAALSLFSTLGYESDRTVESQSVADFRSKFDPESRLEHPAAFVTNWQSAHLLFQLTDEELSGNTALFKDESIKKSLLQSYIFIAIELAEGDYARGKLAGIARQINQIFPMPVMVLFKIGELLSIAVINRRQNKRDESRDVLGKVTLIQNIAIEKPHPGHLDILASFSLAELTEGRRVIENFDQMHAAWEEVFNVELLNKRFYRELANWYFWALPQVDFPADIEKDDEKRRATGLIRLLTRLIFCWFLREKGLVPDKLFSETALKDILKDLSPEISTYHEAILQNLFFATLNQRMGKDAKGVPFRAFIDDVSVQQNRATMRGDALYRYEDHFLDPDAALDQFADVPFLNGGLFECLDYIDESTNEKRYLDGFSRDPEKRPVIPNRVFFGNEHDEDLSAAYGDKKRKKEKVRGLLRILHAYKFTIVENTPVDQEIALDPELLGKVFENLLASYNEETKTTARKQTGSFYTPRPIVEYMVDGALKSHLANALIKGGKGDQDARAGLDILFSYSERVHPFSEKDVATLLDAIHTCKILDPACGSGAFPMGMLHKLVYIIHKLDPDNARWKQIQIDAATKIPDFSARDAAISAIERDFADNEDDYGRKLYLIENCLYGVDIQPIAIQISKLRFFISLICDQRTNRNKRENHGVRPLPNLETKFVVADTLTKLPEIDQFALLPGRVFQVEGEIEALYHNYFAIQRHDHKLVIQKKIKVLREELGRLLSESLGSSEKARHIADWDPFDPQTSCDFFDPHWMFGKSLSDGFDIVLGNPPYVFGGNVGISEKNKKIYKKTYVSGSGKINLFTIFIERGSQLLKAGGVLTYILPNTLLRVTSYKNIRNYILENLQIDEVLDLDVGVFDAVTASTIVIRLKRCRPQVNWMAEIKHGLDDVEQKRSRQSDWLANGGTIDIFSNERDRNIIEHLESGSVCLGELCSRIRFGVVISGNLAEVVDDVSHGDGWKPFLEGDEIGPYTLQYRGRFLNYDPALLHRSRTRDIFECRKIMILRITGGQTPLKATLDDENFYNKESILNLILMPQHSDKYEFILAVLNSKIGNWFYRKRFTNNSKLTVNLSKEYVGQIPIKIPASERILGVFGSLVNMLILSKKVGELAPARFLEDLVDACVMECYFHEHMAERDILFLEDLASQVSAYDMSAPEAVRHNFILELYRALNAPASIIRNRLLRISADSPELLAVIKNEEVE